MGGVGTDKLCDINKMGINGLQDQKSGYHFGYKKFAWKTISNQNIRVFAWCHRSNKVICSFFDFASLFCHNVVFGDFKKVTFKRFKI